MHSYFPTSLFHRLNISLSRWVLQVMFVFFLCSVLGHFKIYIFKNDCFIRTCKNLNRRFEYTFKKLTIMTHDRILQGIFIEKKKQVNMTKKCHNLILIFFKEFLHELYQSVKWFGSISGPTFYRFWSGSKLFAKVISKWQTTVSASKERV